MELKKIKIDLLNIDNKTNKLKNKNYENLIYITNKTMRELNELNKMLDNSKDKDFNELIKTEYIFVKNKLILNYNKLKSLTDFNFENDIYKNGIILELRSGTGGIEANLFTKELFKMYEKFIIKMNWIIEILSVNYCNNGGIKEIIISVNGINIYYWFKFESGVHRVQRIPETDTKGRVHTSTVTVALLPEIKEIDMQIPLNDIKIETMKSTGAGGQHINTTDSAVRITHIPTGITVISSQKSQYQNKNKAMKLLRTKLYSCKKKKFDKNRAIHRKKQIGSALRVERVRTYNFIQDRITDHRLPQKYKNISKILNGDIKNLIKDLNEYFNYKFL